MDNIAFTYFGVYRKNSLIAAYTTNEEAQKAYEYIRYPSTLQDADYYVDQLFIFHKAINP